MIFNTSWFLLFFLIFYFFLWLMPTPRIRFFYTLTCSAIFHYHFAGPAGIKPIIVMAVITFFLAMVVARCPEGSAKKKWVYALALLVPVFGLVFYKYRALLLGSLGPLVGGSVGGWMSANAIQPAMPLAISFFTFEFVHYLTDIYHGHGEPIKNPFKFGIFCIFFPSIVSGPIKRFQPFLAQLEEGLERPAPSKAFIGLAQVLLGFFKKLVIADNATTVIHLLEKRTDLTFGPVCLWLALLSIRILFDFSGYSDIAIGLGKMIGLDLPANFNFPYIARNITDFWRRWHMSLSSWIRDYIYIPLGGNRHGLVRKFFNLMVTMFICGLWHGASWHFGLWGMYHGAALALHNAWEKSKFGQKWIALPFSRWVDIGATNVFVAYGWLLFFYPLDQVIKITQHLFQF
ncbi:MAG TPA: MBOAT family O-acyltransferase [bacterium]|nr:MBOAT family O-acyltransferase [bacterium]